MKAPGSESVPFYEELALAGLFDSPLRPGGLGLTARAISHCHFPANSRLLDLGCGNGATLEYLRTRWGMTAVGVDPSSFLLGLGSRREKGLLFARATGEHLPFAADTLDGVLLECVLSVTGEVTAVLAECTRVLKHGGHLIVTDVYRHAPAEPRNAEIVQEECCLSGALKMDDLLDRLDERGFTTVLWEDHSKVLKEFAAELILRNIPVNPAMFWPAGKRESRWPCSSSPTTPIQEKPGYFLLVARLDGSHKTKTF